MVRSMPWHKLESDDESEYSRSPLTGPAAWWEEQTGADAPYDDNEVFDQEESVILEEEEEEEESDSEDDEEEESDSGDIHMSDDLFLSGESEEVGFRGLTEEQKENYLQVRQAHEEVTERLTRLRNDPHFLSERRDRPYDTWAMIMLGRLEREREAMGWDVRPMIDSPRSEYMKTALFGQLILFDFSLRPNPGLWRVPDSTYHRLTDLLVEKWMREERFNAEVEWVDLCQRHADNQSWRYSPRQSRHVPEVYSEESDEGARCQDCLRVREGLYMQQHVERELEHEEEWDDNSEVLGSDE